jgi:hypothetical protein
MLSYLCTREFYHALGGGVFDIDLAKYSMAIIGHHCHTDMFNFSAGIGIMDHKRILFIAYKK